MVKKYMKILGVESSSTAASAAVLSDGKIISAQFSNTGFTHSQTLMPMVKNVLDIAGINISEIDLLAVTNGPGSFTGIRIGVAAVKGLAQPLNKKCIGVSTLEVIAKSLEATGVYAVSVMDARCSQVYTAQFDCLGDGEMVRVTDDEAISIDELTERLSGVLSPIVLIGDGALLCYGKMRDKLKNVRCAPPTVRYQSATATAVIASERFNKNSLCAVSADELVPVYLRLSQAERELKKKQSDK